MRDYLTPLFRKSNAKSELDPDSAAELITSKNWARLVHKSQDGELRLADMGKKCIMVPPSILEKILNKMYRKASDENADEDEDFSIEFNFAFFGQSNSSNYSIPETWYIWLLSQSKPHQDLIKHPVVETFMDTKWSKVRSFYYFDVICQIILAMLWTIYSITDTTIRFKSKKAITVSHN